MDADNSDESDGEMAQIEINENDVIQYYFQSGFPYKEIIGHLKKHGINISKSTLLRRLKILALSRRSNSRIAQNEYLRLRARIQDMISGPDSCGGYRMVWHALRIEGYQIPRDIVQFLLKELDPEGVEARKAHRLKRRIYSNPGPNFAWHIDGYDKLKHFGFPIHGCIDGFSRKVLWLEVCRSNNSPDAIAKMYLDTVAKVEGCPMELITDLGTENGIAAAAQAFFCDDADAHRYVPSPRNQRIESWWSQLSKSRSVWWRDLFTNLESERILDLSDETNKECLWYCFHNVLQDDLNRVMHNWNTHYIRKSRHGTIAGRPDTLYYLFENVGASDKKIIINPQKLQYAKSSLIEIDDESEFKEYFNYAMETGGLIQPTNWKEAVSLFEELSKIATTGR